MYIIDDGIKLDAKLEMPESFSGHCPLVIIIHGFTGDKEEAHIVAMSDLFNRLGCAALRADMYGHGKSGGRFRDHTLYKWLTNIMTLVDYARGLDFVTDIYLCGHSQGGLAVILAAAMEREFIKGLIPLSPAANIPGCARHGVMLGYRFDTENIPDEIPVDEELTLGGNYIRVAQTISVEDAVARYKGPVLLVHGSADETIDVKVSADLQKEYENAELAVIEGDTHCYDYHLDEAVEAVRKWMERQLQQK